MSDEEDGLALEDNSAPPVESDDDEDGLLLEDNDRAADDDDDDGLLLEDNGTASSGDEDGDGDDGELQLQVNDDGSDVQLETNDGGDDEHDDGLKLEGNDVAESAAPPAPPGIAEPSLVGERVVLRGIKAKPELNGNFGHAVSLDAGKGRYGVKVVGIGMLALKPENVFAAPLPSLVSSVERGAEGEAPTDFAPAPAADAAALSPDERVLGEIALQHERAMDCQRAGRNEECGQILGGLIMQARRALGDAHAETLAIMNNLSAILQSVGKLSEAAPLALEVVERRKATVGARDSTTLNALTNLGSLYYTQGDHKAVDVRREVLEARRELHGSHDPRTLAAMDMLALALTLRPSLVVDDFCEGEVLEELEEAVALLVEELAALLKAHGKACKEQVPAETRQTAGRVYNLVMKQPELGLAVKGYNELVVVLQYALMGKEGI